MLESLGSCAVLTVSMYRSMFRHCHHTICHPAVVEIRALEHTAAAGALPTHHHPGTAMGLKDNDLCWWAAYATSRLNLEEFDCSAAGDYKRPVLQRCIMGPCINLGSETARSGSFL